MNLTESTIRSGFKLQLEVTDLLAHRELGESADSFGRFFLGFDTLFFKHGAEPAFEAVSAALSLMVLSPTKRLSVLTALLRLGSMHCSDRIGPVREALFGLVDADHVEISVEAYCADINRHIWNDRADLAVAALLEHLSRLKDIGATIPTALFLEAAFTCNRFERHFLATEFSYLAYNQALKYNSEYSIDRAQFFILNSNRLAGEGGNQLRGGYARQVLKVESGNSQSFHLNQFLTLIFASFTELASGCPDMKRVDRYLGLAKDIGQPKSDYCHKAWLAATGLQAFHLRRKATADDAHEEIWRCTDRQDRAVDQMTERLGLNLKSQNVYQPLKPIVPAKNSEWQALREFAQSVA